MPRASKVTFALVATAARTLASSNRNPTTSLVRQMLNGGSTDLISKFLREWKEREYAPSGVGIGASLRPSIELTLGEMQRRLEGIEERHTHLADRVSAEIKDLGRRLASLESALERSGANAASAAPTKRAAMAEAQRLRNKGMTAKQVAAVIGMSVRWVQLHTYSPKRSEASTGDQKALAIKMRNEGASIAEISRVTGRSWTWARVHASK